MPDGGVSEDLHNYKLMQDYIAANAEHWYQCVGNNGWGMLVENGDLQVVTGTDKTSSWGMATFENVDMDPIRFELKEDKIAMQGRTYEWDTIPTGRVGPREEEIRDLMQGPNTSPLVNQCVFIRTLTVSVLGKSWNHSAVQEVRTSGTRDYISNLRWYQGQFGQRNVNVQTPQPVSSLVLILIQLPKYFRSQAHASTRVFKQASVTKGSHQQLELGVIKVRRRNLHAATDLFPLVKNNTSPSFEDISARVLVSRKKGSFYISRCYTMRTLNIVVGDFRLKKRAKTFSLIESDGPSSAGTLSNAPMVCLFTHSRLSAKSYCRTNVAMMNHAKSGPY